MLNALEIKQMIYTNSMNLFQIIAVSCCVLISFIDGFDVLAIAFVAPSIAEQWHLTLPQLGELFSAALAGMVIGALVISPFADKYGRRVIILVCLLILTFGMFASGMSTSHSQLVISRLFTGTAMGAVLPSLNTIVAEYSSHRYRSLAISFMTTGYTAGSLAGGAISIYLISYFGWQYVFYFGGAISLLMIPVVMMYLPESLEFILSQQPKVRSLHKLNRLLTKLNMPTCDVFPTSLTSLGKSKRHFRLLLSPKIFNGMLLLCLSAFMLMCSFYFLVNWMPKILVNLGYSKQISITGSMLMSLFGIVGGILLGWLSKAYSVQKITALMLISGFIVVTLFGFSYNVLALLFVLISFIGLNITGAMTGLYATAPQIFPPEVRTTATGIVLGIARLGATIGPYIAGLLIAAELPRYAYFSILALPMLLAAIFILMVKTQKE